jgi:hypothetical protein
MIRTLVSAKLRLSHWVGWVTGRVGWRSQGIWPILLSRFEWHRRWLSVKLSFLRIVRLRLLRFFGIRRVLLVLLQLVRCSAWIPCRSPLI